MTSIHEDAAEAVDDLIGAIWQRQLEIAREQIEEQTSRSFESTEEVKKHLHLFFDLDEIPDEYRELEYISDRLDAAYHALKGEDLAGDEDRFSTDLKPDKRQVNQFLERLREIDAAALAELDEDEIDEMQSALELIQD